jgi:membrane protease YdiL (CAAX protease family)
MEATGQRLPAAGAWRGVLMCFAVVLLFCAVKNYLVYLLQGSPLCAYLCPSLFGGRTGFLPGFLTDIYQYQVWLEDMGQFYVDVHWSDPYRVASFLLIAPVLEEALYRGPLFLLHDHAPVPWWWVAATALGALFAFSHDRSGLLLLPPLVLGLSSAWLIAFTGRFWPSVALHLMNNLYFLSITFYQSLYSSA